MPYKNTIYFYDWPGRQNCAHLNMNEEHIQPHMLNFKLG